MGRHQHGQTQRNQGNLESQQVPCEPDGLYRRYGPDDRLPDRSSVGVNHLRGSGEVSRQACSQRER